MYLLYYFVCYCLGFYRRQIFGKQRNLLQMPLVYLKTISKKTGFHPVDSQYRLNIYCSFEMIRGDLLHNDM